MSGVSTDRQPRSTLEALGICAMCTGVQRQDADAQCMHLGRPAQRACPSQTRCVRRPAQLASRSPPHPPPGPAAEKRNRQLGRARGTPGMQRHVLYKTPTRPCAHGSPHPVRGGSHSNFIFAKLINSNELLIFLVSKSCFAYKSNGNSTFRPQICGV